jgi:hypothetical protein
MHLILEEERAKEQELQTNLTQFKLNMRLKDLMEYQ